MAVSAKQSHTKIRLKPTFPVRHFSPFLEHSTQPLREKLAFLLCNTCTAHEPYKRRSKPCQAPPKREPPEACRNQQQDFRRPSVFMVCIRQTSPPENLPDDCYYLQQRGFSCLKKSLPLSSTRMNAGKSSTSIFQIASIPSSGYSTHSMLLMLFCARMAAGPPIEPR